MCSLQPPHTCSLVVCSVLLRAVGFQGSGFTDKLYRPVVCSLRTPEEGQTVKAKNVAALYTHCTMTATWQPGLSVGTGGTGLLSSTGARHRGTLCQPPYQSLIMLTTNSLQLHAQGAGRNLAASAIRVLPGGWGGNAFNLAVPATSLEPGEQTAPSTGHLGAQGPTNRHP
jgi:hypothetical protein